MLIRVLFLMLNNCVIIGSITWRQVTSITITTNNKETHMKLTFTFDTTVITAEKFGDVWNIADSVVGTVSSRLEDAIKTLEARRQQVWQSYFTRVMDLLYTMDLNRITTPTMLTDMENNKLCWIVPQGRAWVLVPLGLPTWLDTPMTGRSPVAMTDMWRQWKTTMPESPDLKEVKEVLSKL